MAAIAARLNALFDSPWPAEDGGPKRQAHAASGLGLQPGERLAATTRSTLVSTMVVLGAPGEVFLLTHSVLPAQLGLPTQARVERLDPETLRPLVRSSRLPGGPMWPGGMAVLGNGDIYVVYGRWLHRLGRDCRIKAALKLPVDAAYNSFVVLACGLVVTKNLSDSVPARLSVIDPESCAEIAAFTCPEASIARLSADGDTVYLVGVTTIIRLHWTGSALVVDPDWRWEYLGDSGNSYGWDVVLAAGHAWFMDNGRHRYRTRMIGAGVNAGANRLLRVSLGDARNHAAVAVSGLPRGSITNPPLVDPARRIVIAYDSANRHLQAFDFDLQPLWHKSGFGAAGHVLLLGDCGELVTNDFGRGGEAVVVLDIATGAERGRVAVGGVMQGVVFPCPGWNRDLYWCSMAKVARVFVS